MKRIAAWAVGEATPERLLRSQEGLEKDLETWIDNDPALIGEGFQILARQLTLDFGGRLDLLAVDPQGRLAIIELKRDAVYEETVTQALTYAATIAAAPKQDLIDRLRKNADLWNRDLPKNVSDLFDDSQGDREVISIVAGCGLDRGTERLLEHLSGKYGVPIRAVSFEIFDQGVTQIVTRAVTEVDESETDPRPRYSVEAVTQEADRVGLGSAFRALTGAIEAHPELYPKPWAKCIMCAPKKHRGRALFTYWAERDNSGRMKMWIGPQAFEEFFPTTIARVQELLGGTDDGYVWFGHDQVQRFISNLATLIDEFRKEKNHPDENALN